MRPDVVADGPNQRLPWEAFAALWAEERYFEAHEVLEELWVNCGRPRGGWLQAGILAAVAMEHCKRGNQAGARRLLTRACGMAAGGHAPEEDPEVVERALHEARVRIDSRQ